MKGKEEKTLVDKKNSFIRVCSYEGMSSMRKVTSGKIDLTKRWVAHTQRSQIHWPVWKVVWLSQKLWPFPRSSDKSESYAPARWQSRSSLLHRGHVELPPGDVLELSSGNVENCAWADGPAGRKRRQHSQQCRDGRIQRYLMTVQEHHQGGVQRDHGEGWEERDRHRAGA